MQYIVSQAHCVSVAPLTFIVLANHYLFEPVACTPASGWEKGVHPVSATA